MTQKAIELGNDPMQWITSSVRFSGKYGQTKREYFAGLAMQIIISKDVQLIHKDVAINAVAFADALLEELSNT